MSLWIDEKYLRFLSPMLDRFTQKHPHVFNFRCPLCGDSEKNKTKARGFCFPKGQVLIYKCHNCSVALPFAALLKRVSRRLYDEYLLENLREGGNPQAPLEAPAEDAGVPAIVLSDTPSMLLRRLDKVTPRDAEYAAVEYVDTRCIAREKLTRLYATTHAYSWLTPLVGEDKAAKVSDGEVYLVFPLTLPDGKWYGAQVRLLTRKEYITFRWAAEPLKVFGLDHWTPTKRTYIVEGPFDSLFIENGIAACGSDLMGVIRIMIEQKLMGPADLVVYVWDNEPRNKEVVRHLRTAVKLHEFVVIWPRSFPKDINDAVLKGLGSGSVTAVLAQSTVKGLQAELEFQVWQR